jgi:hypothetical protein
MSLDWTPPAGMLPDVIISWRAFYRRIQEIYGVTPAQYRAIYLAQLGRCFGCQDKRGIHPDDPNGRGSVRLAVDHNHALGFRPEAVRALLCRTGDMSCNRILGAIKDSPYVLERLAVVVREMPAQAAMRALADGLPDEKIQGMVLHP